MRCEYQDPSQLILTGYYRYTGDLGNLGKKRNYKSVDLFNLNLYCNLIVSRFDSNLSTRMDEYIFSPDEPNRPGALCRAAIVVGVYRGDQKVTLSDDQRIGLTRSVEVQTQELKGYAVSFDAGDDYWNRSILPQLVEAVPNSREYEGMLMLSTVGVAKNHSEWYYKMILMINRTVESFREIAIGSYREEFAEAWALTGIENSELAQSSWRDSRLGNMSEFLSQREDSAPLSFKIGTDSAVRHAVAKRLIDGGVTPTFHSDLVVINLVKDQAQAIKLADLVQEGCLYPVDCVTVKIASIPDTVEDDSIVYRVPGKHQYVLSIPM